MNTVNAAERTFGIRMQAFLLFFFLLKKYIAHFVCDFLGFWWTTGGIYFNLKEKLFIVNNSNGFKKKKWMRSLSRSSLFSPIQQMDLFFKLIRRKVLKGIQLVSVMSALHHMVWFSISLFLEVQIFFFFCAMERLIWRIGKRDSLVLTMLLFTMLHTWSDNIILIPLQTLSHYGIFFPSCKSIVHSTAPFHDVLNKTQQRNKEGVNRSC